MQNLAVKLLSKIGRKICLVRNDWKQSELVRFIPVPESVAFCYTEDGELTT